MSILENSLALYLIGEFQTLIQIIKEIIILSKYRFLISTGFGNIGSRADSNNYIYRVNFLMLFENQNNDYCHIKSTK